MLSFSRSAVRAIRSSAILLFASVMAHAAAVTVTPTVTSIGGGLYQYAYSISYTGTDDAFLIDIAVPKSPTAITNLMTPSGFTSQFDSVLGLASFLEGTSSFTSAPTSGFSFDSPDAPGTAAFTASLLDSSFNIYTISGSTLAPTVTPEPAYLYLLAFLLPAFLLLKRRKRERVTAPFHLNNPTEALHV